MRKKRRDEGGWRATGVGRRKNLWMRVYRFDSGERLVVFRCRYTWQLRLAWAWRPTHEYGLSMDVEEELMSKFRNMASLSRTAKPSQIALNDKWFETKFPALLDHLGVDEVEGKKIRTCSLTLFIEQGCLKASLNDREADRVMFAAGESLEALLTALEGMLQSDMPPWRLSNGNGGTTRKKKS